MAVIRVSGDLGSGKTTLCEKMAEALNYENYYIGDIMRQLADKRGMIIDDFFRELEKEPELEREIDAAQEQLMLNQDNIIVQGRMAPFLGCGFEKINVYIAVDSLVGAKRMSSRPEYQGKTMEDIAEMARKRVVIERERYQKLYRVINHLDISKFDAWIDTTHMTEDESLVRLMSLLSVLL